MIGTTYIGRLLIKSLPIFFLGLGASFLHAQTIQLESHFGLTHNYYEFAFGNNMDEVGFTVNTPVNYQLSASKFVAKRSELALQLRHNRSNRVWLDIEDCNCTFQFTSLFYNRLSFEYRYHLLPENNLQPYIGVNYGLHLASQKNYGEVYFDSTSKYLYFFNNQPSTNLILSRPSFQSIGLVSGLNWKIHERWYVMATFGVEVFLTTDFMQNIWIVYKSPSSMIEDFLWDRGFFLRTVIGIGFSI